MAKSVLITGCSTGIGAALVTAFQKRGLTVFATARNPSSLSSFSNLPNVHLLALDVTSETSVRETFEQVKVKTGGKLDYLVNNAGIGAFIPALDVDIEDGKKMFDTNFWGALRMIQVFAPALIQAKGTIVNVGSGLGFLAGPYSSIYNASKAAIHMLSDTLHLELGPLGVKVVTVVSGSVSTNFLTNVPEPKLPQDSHYLSVEKQVKTIARGEQGLNPMPVNEFAEKVVGDILGGATGRVWRGGSATLARVAFAVFPQWLINRIMLQPSGLTEMAASNRRA